MRCCRFAVVVIAVAVAALLAGAGPSVARAAGACPTLDVSGARAGGALRAGTYALTPLAGTDEPCAAAATVVESYLYDPRSFRSWRVAALPGGRLRFSARGAAFVASPTSRLVRSAGPPAAAASFAPTATAAATRACPSFRVRHNDSAVGFPAGTYHRLNFSPTNVLRCSPPMPDSYDLLRDYLRDGDVHGYKVGPLTGALAKQPGCRFLKNATKTTGFDVWCDGKGSSRGPCVKARPVPQNCGGHY